MQTRGLMDGPIGAPNATSMFKKAFSMHTALVCEGDRHVFLTIGAVWWAGDTLKAEFTACPPQSQLQVFPPALCSSALQHHSPHSKVSPRSPTAGSVLLTTPPKLFLFQRTRTHSPRAAFDLIHHLSACAAFVLVPHLSACLRSC